MGIGGAGLRVGNYRSALAAPRLAERDLSILIGKYNSNGQSLARAGRSWGCRIRTMTGYGTIVETLTRVLS
jgi:hypothetical protein